MSGLQRPPTPTFNQRTVVVSNQSDMVLNVMSVKHKIGPHHNQRSLTKFKVKKEVLKTFGCFPGSFRFNAAYGHETTLKDDNEAAIGVWLIYMHAAKDTVASDTTPGDGEGVELTPEEQAAKKRKIDAKTDAVLFKRRDVFDTDINRIWHMINAGDKYQFDGTILIGFFENWFAANVNMGSMDADFARQLALPCYMFDHAKGFSDITKWLAYNFGGHITENRPAGFRWKHMHLSPPDFVGPMNHARGGLKTVLHRGIWNRVGKLLEQGPESNLCDEWDTVAGRYFAELVRIDAYPLETIFPKHSMNTILERLEKFKLGDIGDCFCCEIDWRHHITKSIENTRTNFHGLCIDCMDSSKPKRGSTDEDYWMHLGTVGGRWDTHCRVKHGQQTWYVSWLGRSEHRQKLLNKANEIRAEIRARLPY